MKEIMNLRDKNSDIKI